MNTATKDNKLKKILLGIFIFALFLRLLAVVVQEESKKLPLSDAAHYDQIAMNIVSGYGFSEIIDGQKVLTMRRTPVYPLFLAGIYSIFGHNYFAVKIIQAILGALFCIVIFLIANIIYDNRIIGIMASMAVAMYRPFISGFYYYGGPGLLLTECFYMFIAGLAILTLLSFIKNEKNGILAGILIGLTVLTRPDFIFFLVVLTFYLIYIARRSIAKLFKKYFLVYVFIILTMAPWVARNYLVSGKFVPLTSLGGLVFWCGNNTAASGGWANPENFMGKVYSMENISDYERNRIWFRKGIEELKSNPKRIPGLFIKKILVHWAPFEERFAIFNPYYAIVLLFSSIGILFFRKHSVLENILLLLFFSTTLRAIIIWGDPRYRYPDEPYLIIFAALTIYKIVTKQRGVLDCEK